MKQDLVTNNKSQRKNKQTIKKIKKKHHQRLHFKCYSFLPTYNSRTRISYLRSSHTLPLSASIFIYLHHRQADTILTTTVAVELTTMRFCRMRSTWMKKSNVHNLYLQLHQMEKRHDHDWNGEKRATKKSVGNGNCLVWTTCTSNTFTKHIIPKSRTNYLIIEEAEGKNTPHSH